MAQFGVTTAMVSIVLSVFMAGLAIGSLVAGAWARRLDPAVGPRVPLWLYAAVEIGIASSGEIVPRMLSTGHRVLAASSADAFWGSVAYHAASGAWVAAALLPFCICMGATFPLGMWVMRRRCPGISARSFSYLYLANVLGAATGALSSAFVLIELLGFRGTLSLTAALNAVLASAALVLSLVSAPSEESSVVEVATAIPAEAAATDRRLLWALLATGLASLAMEVVGVRQFTPFLGNVVYAFAILLTTYLVATSLGSSAYRRWMAHGSVEARNGWAWALLAVAGLLPLVAADPRLPLQVGLSTGALRLAAGIGPFCAILGFLSPMLVDRWSSGDPDRAGRAYAVNVVGCIVGPLLAGFLLVPSVGERWALVMLALPLAVIGSFATSGGGGAGLPWARGAVAAVAAVFTLVATRDYASLTQGAVRRDSTATVTATGKGMDRSLLVNGIGMTFLTPITKTMAHLPLAFLERPPRKALTICFGMGTSFRSVSSWGIGSTAVELVPSVPALFDYFHADAHEVLARPQNRIVIDDGRRFLERSPESFDVVIVDPPPPLEAAGSSLLYSVEFYELAKRRLEPGGILQAWIPGGDAVVVAAMVKAIQHVFPHVRAFVSIEGWGVHLLASQSPLPPRSPEELASRLPNRAANDLVEWGPVGTPRELFALVLERELALERIIDRAPEAPILRDDVPINEYFLLRRTLQRWRAPREGPRRVGN